MGPTLLIDGGCGFCRRAGRFLSPWVEPVAVIAWQRADPTALTDAGISAADLARSVQLVGLGTVRRGAPAIAAALRAGRPPARLIGGLLAVPGVSHAAARIYAAVAANRSRLPASWGEPADVSEIGSGPSDPLAPQN